MGTEQHAVTRLTFRTIDLETNERLCVDFRRDSFELSFGDASRFDESEYTVWLRERIAECPGLCVHAFDARRIVGQIEGHVERGDRTKGYVHLFYLVPDMRGRCLGAQLDRHVERFFRGEGVHVARLAVSDSNRRARRFYAGRGWADLGARPGRPGERLMELSNRGVL